MQEFTEITTPSIRMGEFRVARDGAPLRTLLGSCIGLALYDRRRCVAGLAHIILPESRGVKERPGKFVDTAIPALIENVEDLCGESLRLSAKIAGGASMFPTSAKQSIGDLNVQACEQALRDAGIPILARHCGGTQGRKMTLDSSSGIVRIEIVGTDPIEM